jgi:hypothetical protein
MIRGEGLVQMQELPAHPSGQELHSFNQLLLRRFLIEGLFLVGNAGELPNRC